MDADNPNDLRWATNPHNQSISAPLFSLRQPVSPGIDIEAKILTGDGDQRLLHFGSVHRDGLRFVERRFGTPPSFWAHFEPNRRLKI